MSISRLGLLLALAATFAHSHAAERKLVKSEKHNFQLVTLVEGLEHPWSMAWLPDGRMLVTERGGRLRTVSKDFRLDPKPVEGLPRIFVGGQGGLFDVVLHPSYQQNRWIYLSYAGPGAGGQSTELMRAKLEGGRLVDQQVLYRLLPKTTTDFHFGGRIVFDGKGHLFLTLGERGDPDRAQRLSDAAGGVIRLNDDGRVPKDNPFVARDEARAERYTYGNRNPQGAAINPRTGQLWTHEHGPRGGDEVNIMRPGRNYGWPVITYGHSYSTNEPIGEGTSRPGVEPPVHYWVPSIAPSGMAFYEGDKFPAWRGNILVGALSAAILVRLELDGDKVVKEERMIQNAIGRIRDVRVGPDGFVYLLSDEKKGVLARLEPVNQ
jgi:glucose/arabinose dehydrogenase